MTARTAMSQRLPGRRRAPTTPGDSMKSSASVNAGVPTLSSSSWRLRSPPGVRDAASQSFITTPSASSDRLVSSLAIAAARPGPSRAARCAEPGDRSRVAASAASSSGVAAASAARAATSGARGPRHSVSRPSAPLSDLARVCQGTSPTSPDGAAECARAAAAEGSAQPPRAPACDSR